VDEEPFLFTVTHVASLTRRVKTLRLQPSSGRMPFRFLPGQHIGVRPDEPSGRNAAPEGVWRHFSLSNSPLEGEYIEITVLDQGEASARLHALRPQDAVWTTRPAGRFLLGDTLGHGPVFFAAGIGAAPIRSMVRYCLDKGIGEEATLFLSFSTERDALFLRDFQRWEKESKRLSVWTAFTRAHGVPGEQPTRGSPWSRSLLEASIQRPAERFFFVCVPKGLLEKLLPMLFDMGIPAEKIRREIW